MPYVQGVSEKVCRFLNRAGVKTYYSRSKKLRDILSHPKDPQPKDHGPCVYSIPCSCGEQYIGQTKRPLQVRLNEHKKATENKKIEKSALAEHACKEGHEPIWDDSKSLVQVPHKGTRHIREALEIRTNENTTINRMDGKKISRMWNSLSYHGKS
ncbi:uncharacterized protein [Amphiura filiformis]|uniref:uncharacterized protein n=1 Tax=Amphiura filiformis TaxID=82378 RepID=UPI003B21C49C